MAQEKFPIELIERSLVTPTVLRLLFRRSDDQVLVFKPGQFINIHFEHQGKDTHRSYSLANPPRPDGALELLIAPVEHGAATTLLFDLAVGAELEASGPYGKFVLKDDPPARYVLVATGTGIAPYRAMLPELVERVASGAFEVELLLGVRRPEELIYADEFAAAAAAHDGFRFYACYSRAFPETPESYEFRGYVSERYPRLNLDPERDIVYLCGNPNMVDEAVGLLKELAFPRKQMRREKYVSAHTS